MIGISRSSLVNIEKCRQRPSIFLLYEISRIGRVEMSDIFDSIENITSENIISNKIQKTLDKEQLDEDSMSKVLYAISNVS